MSRSASRCEAHWAPKMASHHYVLQEYQRICVCATHVSRLNADWLAFGCYYDRGSAAPMSFSSLVGDKM